MENALPRRILLRPLVLPFEHGAWGFLFEPIVLGLALAPTVSGLFVAIGAVATFLVRHPLRLALKDRLQGKRHARTLICEGFALGYAAVAVVSFASLAVTEGLSPFLPLFAALPFAGLQLALDIRNQGRSLSAEITGSLAAGATVSAIALAGGQSAPLAFALWLLMALRAVPSILYVRTTLRGELRTVMVSAHLAAIAVAALLVSFRLAPWTAPLAMTILLLRALPPPGKLRARDIGVREIAYGAVTVVLLVAAAS